MKKLLMGITASSLVATLSTQVVSCGPATFAKLMAREVDPTIYRGTFAAPMTSWSSATTQTASDSWILTNANDMLLASDQYNNFEGDLADNWGPTAYTGADNDNAEYRAWGFHVREGQLAPVWTRLSRENVQSVVRPIVARDFFNTFRFIFNPNNISQTVGVWQQILDYADDLNTFLGYLRNQSSDPSFAGLYEQRFSRTSDPGENNGVVQSSFFIDRAILAFNITPVRATDINGMMAVRNRALDVTPTFNNNYNIWAQDTNELVQESFNTGKIINSGSGSGFNLVYNLLKPAEYFESMASFLSFAPMPDEAVDYLNQRQKNMAGTNYGAPSPTGEYGYQRIFYSGAYVVTDYNPSLKLVMEKNKFYFNRDNVPIKTLSYSYTGAVDISRQRFYFETGDLSEFMVSSSDLSGWKKYVGDDFDNPRFQGTNITSRPQAGTQSFFFNFNSTRTEPQTNAANQALAQRSTRAFLRYIFDRSEAAKFYSKARDGSDPTSHNLRNTWTAPNVGIWKNPENQPVDYLKFLYQDYMALPADDNPKPPVSGQQTIVDWLTTKLALDNNQFNDWSQRFGSAEGKDLNGEPIQVSSWVDGFDPYLRNDLIGAYVFMSDDRTQIPGGISTLSDNFVVSPLMSEYVPLIGDYSTQAEAQKLQLIKQQVRNDLAELNIATSPIDVVFLANGSTSTGLNNYIKLAVQTFNFRVGADSPIRLIVKESKDAADYSNMLSNGEFSIIIFGWISDYSDPYGFLHAIVYNGDIGEYAGFSRLFETSESSNELAIKIRVRQGIPNSEVYQDLLARLQYFTNQSAQVDLTVPNSPERYTKMAEIENYAILESMITIPILTQYLDNVPYVSYVNPFTRTTFASGSPIYRFVGVSMISRLWDHATYNRERQRYEAARNAYVSKYPGTNGQLITVKNGDWRESNS